MTPGPSGGRRPARRPPEPPPGGPGGPDADPEAAARTIALRLLTAAPRTRAELADALAARGVPDGASERVLDRFAEVGLVDDAAFAEAWAASRQSTRGLAGPAIAAGLRRRGVADELVRETVAGLDPDAQVDRARRLVGARLPATRGLPAATRARRLAGMLARKGYPSSTALRVVREALAAEGHEDVDADLPGEA